MDYRKVGPALAAAHSDFAERRQASVLRHARVLGLVTTADTAPKPARAVVFLHAKDGSVDFARLQQEHNIEVNGGIGPVRTAIVPLDALDGLSEDPDVDRILGTRQMQPRLDIAKGAVGVNDLVARTGLHGHNVIVGIVDTGIDPNHPSFTGRIMRIWDQTLHGTGVPEGGYGVELEGKNLTMSRDTEGHGTHVSGIAAGADASFGGVAPEADIIMVKSDLQDGHIADGLQYIARIARDQQRPCVINLSLGGHWDAHDGSDSLSRVVDAVSGAGCVICVAAGNEGADNIHARIDVRAGETRVVPCSVPVTPGPNGPALLVFNGWYSGGDALQIAVASPSGLQTPLQGVIETGSPVVDYTLQEARIQVATGPPDPGNNDHQFLVIVQPATGNPTLTGGTWRLVLQGVTIEHGRVDVWALDDLGGSVARFVGADVADDTKIGSPGAATSAITVASYTTRDHWTDIDGRPEQVGFPADDVSDFSSEGPRRDGAEKPDVTAPGAMIVSAMSADSAVERAWMVDGVHRVMAGTSMATPFVAGLVALLLEREPQLGPDKVRAALRSASAIPNRPSGTFDQKWGYGLVNANSL